MSPEKSLREAVRKLTMCEEDLLPFTMESGQPIVFTLLYEKIVKARDLILDALDFED